MDHHDHHRGSGSESHGLDGNTLKDSLETNHHPSWVRLISHLFDDPCMEAGWCLDWPGLPQEVDRATQILVLGFELGITIDGCRYFTSLRLWQFAVEICAESVFCEK